MTLKRRGACAVIEIVRQNIRLKFMYRIVSEVGIAKIHIHIKQKQSLFFMPTSR